MSDEFIREVDEDLRREQLNQFFRRYRWVIIGLIAAVIIIVAGREALIARREARLAANSDRYATLLEATALTQEAAERAQAFAAARADLSDGFSTLAALNQAAAALAAGNAEQARVLYDELAGTPRGLGDLAQILAIFAALDAGMSADAVRDRLEPLSLPAAPYRLTVLELLAMLDLEAGDADRASERLNEILAAPTATPAMRQRVAQWLDQVESSAAPAPLPEAS